MLMLVQAQICGVTRRLHQIPNQEKAHLSALNAAIKLL